MAIVRSGRKKALAKTLNRMVRSAQAKVQQRTNSGKNPSISATIRGQGA